MMEEKPISILDFIISKKNEDVSLDLVLSYKNLFKESTNRDMVSSDLIKLSFSKFEIQTEDIKNKLLEFYSLIIPSMASKDKTNEKDKVERRFAPTIKSLKMEGNNFMDITKSETIAAALFRKN